MRHPCVLFLNDFEYDSKAHEWMPWSFFKDFLEGSAVKVAVPKHRGGNQVFRGDAPVFLTCRDEVVLRKYNREVTSETEQMRKRIKYLALTSQIPEDNRTEVRDVCPHCSARVYLEGKVALDSPPGSASCAAAPACAGQAAFTAPEQPAEKRARLAAECVHRLQQAKVLLDCGALERAEFDRLKADLLGGM